MELEDLPRETLIKLIRAYAKNWLAHDGCWFLAVEQRLGLEAAIELDEAAWACFSPVEARRVMEVLDLAAGGGLRALEQALQYRLYSTLNRQEAEWTPAGKLRFRMRECRVQQARMRKGLPPFPCQPVGLTEYRLFARAIDPRIQTRCVHAPPDPVSDSFCEWEFELE
jgi:hypothetical protein